MTDSLITTADDDFHSMGDDPWATETCWFSFNIPERRMAGWLYGWIRPNMGNSGGGVFLYDDTGVSPWELPYFHYQYTQPLPERRDLRRFTFPTGYSVEMLEPLRRYRLRYQDRKTIALDLEFTAISDPHPFPHGEPPFVSSPHFDQPGRIVGEIQLRGEVIAVDCLSVRDRSWGPRPDHMGSRIGYPFGTASECDAFLCFTTPSRPAPDGREPINHGYLIKEGRRTQIKGGLRRVERDPDRGWLTRQWIEATDLEGRTLEVEGIAQSRMIFAVPRGVTCNSFFKWTINGTEGWGEDQDVWRYDQWLAGHAARQQARQE